MPASIAAKRKLAQTKPRQRCHAIVILQNGTAMGDDTILAQPLQPGIRGIFVSIEPRVIAPERS
jgi:hypothetical protein